MAQLSSRNLCHLHSVWVCQVMCTLVQPSPTSIYSCMWCVLHAWGVRIKYKCKQWVLCIAPRCYYCSLLWFMHVCFHKCSYSRVAYCDVTGRESRLPLRVTGQGIGPRLMFSFDTLDVQNVFVNSAHAYEVCVYTLSKCAHGQWHGHKGRGNAHSNPAPILMPSRVGFKPTLWVLARQSALPTDRAMQQIRTYSSACCIGLRCTHTISSMHLLFH